MQVQKKSVPSNTKTLIRQNRKQWENGCHLTFGKLFIASSNYSHNHPPLAYGNTPLKPLLIVKLNRAILVRVLAGNDSWALAGVQMVVLGDAQWDGEGEVVPHLAPLSSVVLIDGDPGGQHCHPEGHAQPRPLHI